MLRITHIHTDPKFVSSSKDLMSSDFDTKIVFFMSHKGQKLINTSFPPNTIELPLKKKGLSEAAKIAGKSNIVVFWALTGNLIRFALQLPKEVMVVWRFFGYEYYSGHKQYLTDLTYYSLNKSIAKSSLKIMMKGAKTIIKRMLFPISVKKGYQRVNLFIGISQKEFELVRNEFSLDCDFMMYPMSYHPGESSFTHKKRTIVLGHSRSPYNNHLDMLQELRKLNSDQYRFVMLFTYGGESNYTSDVRSLAKEVKNLEIIENHMSKDEFRNLYKQMSAFVLNSKRQLAGGNIMTAFQTGVSVFMRTDNLLYWQLLEFGFIVKPLEEFYLMISRGDDLFDESAAKHNLEIMESLANRFSADKFLENLQMRYREFKTNNTNNQAGMKIQ